MRNKIAILMDDITSCLKISFNTSKYYTIVRIILQVLKSIFPVITAYLLKAVIDVLAGAKGSSFFYFYIMLYLTIQVFTQWISKLDEYYRDIHERLIENHVTKELNKKASSIDISFFDSPCYYDKIQLLRSNIYSINQILWNVISLLSSVVSFMAALLVMMRYHIAYTIIIIASYIPIAFCEQIFIKKMYVWQTEYVREQRKMAYISNLVTQKIYSKSIRLFGLSEYLVDIYTSIWEAWFACRKKIVKKWSTITLILSSLPQILTVLVLISIGIKIMNGEKSLGDFTFYSGIIGQLVTGVFLITFNISRIFDNKIRIKDFNEFYSWANTIEGTGGIELKSIENIVFKNVVFMYPGSDKPILKNFNLEINAREKLALVGSNGSGKTTIVKLLLRFYDVTDGEILINGINIKEYTPQSIRKHFSVLLQDYVNYAFTLRENVRLSDITKKYTDEDILDACNKAGVDQFLKKLDNGLDSYLYREFEESGVELSGGESQKIALSRTFFKDGEFIILDEPSSSLDAESEYLLFKRMMALCDGKGVLLISHRLSNVALAQRIVVIEGGEVIEQGTHEELMRLKGRYAKLFRYQAEQYRIA